MGSLDTGLLGDVLEDALLDASIPNVGIEQLVHAVHVALAVGKALQLAQVVRLGGHDDVLHELLTLSMCR